MANRIVPKKSTVAAKAPLTTDLVTGEIAVNLTDQIIYAYNGTAVVKVGVGKLSSMADVTLSSLTSGQVLQWNGTAWVNVTPAATGVTSFNTRTGAVTLSSADVTSALTYTPLSNAGGNVSGGIAFTGTGSRITGDFSNATLASRLMFQTSTANSSTSVFAIPSGTGNSAAWTAFNGSDPANAGMAQLFAGTGEIQLVSSKNGTGTYLPLAFYTNGAKAFQIGTAGQWGIGATPDYGTAGYVMKSGGAAAAPTWGTLTKTDVGLANVENTALSTWAGSANITTLGTIGTGTWNATNIALGKGGTNAALTAVNGGIVYSNASAMAITAAGTAGQALVSAGAAAPVWTTLTMENIPDAAFKRSVRAATTANLTGTYAANVLTGTLVALPAQDGITLAVGDRLLVKDQTTAAQNGIYVVTNLGVAGTTAWVLTRAADADTASKVAGMCCNVDSGTVNGGLFFDCDFKTTDTLGTTAISFSRVVDTDYLATWAGSSNVTTLGTVATGTWNATAIGVTKGGTGLTSIAALSIPVANSANTYTTVTPLAGQSVRVNAGGTAWEAYTPGTGTVTSVGGTGTVSGLTLTGTVTGSGSLTLGGTLAVTPANFASQTANTVLAAPNGAAGAPTFRALVAADIPALSYAPTAGSASITTLGTIATGTWQGTAIGVAYGGSGLTSIPALSIRVANTANTLTNLTLTAGQALRVNAGATAWEGYTPGTGTVSSVGGTGTVSGLTLSGTVTTTGNLTLGGTLAVTASNFASQTANTFLCAPNGAAGVPTFRTIATADLPTTIQTNTYAPGITGSTSAAVTAAGTTQATATALTSDVNIVTTSTAGTGLGVVMMGATSGKYAVIVNRSANAINLYPASGHQFDGQAVNTPISIPVNGFIEMFGSSTTQWHTTYQAITQASFVVGTHTVAQGGTGVTTLSGLAYGNGTSAMTAATAAQVVAVIGTTAVTNATNATNATNLTGSGTISASTTGATAAAKTATTAMATTAFVDRFRSLHAQALIATGGTPTVADRGCLLVVSGGVTIPASVFATGDTFTIYNNSAANITITQGASMTLRLVGSATTGNRTLAQRGMATVVFISATEAVMSGGGLT